MRAVLDPFHLGFGDVVRVVVDGPPPHEISSFPRGVGRPGIEIDVGQLVAQGFEIIHGGLLFPDPLPVQFRLPDGGKVHSGQGQADAQIDVGQGAFDGVPAFQHGDVRLEHGRHFGVAVGGEVHVGDGVGEVVVLPGGVDDQVGFEMVEDGQHHAFHGHEVAVVGRARGHGNVDGPAQSLGAARFRGEARARIQGASVLMQGDEEHVGVVPVDVLGAVPVMAVRVHHSHAQIAVVLADPFDHDGFNVHVAEAPAAVNRAHGVMSRRPDHGEGPVPFLAHDELRGADGSSGRNEMGMGAHVGHTGKTEMRAHDVCFSGDDGPVFMDAFDVENAFLPKLVLGVEQTLLPFGMGGGDGPVEGRKEDDAEAGSGFEHGSSVQEARVAMVPGRIWQRTRMLRPMV